MARRKRAFLEDELDSSEGSGGDDDLDEPFPEDNDPDSLAERRLFEDPYQRKKRRVGGKVDPTYGVFADDVGDEDIGRHGGHVKEKRLHFTQAPAFVSGEDKKVNLDDEMSLVDDDGAGDQIQEESSNDDAASDDEDDLNPTDPVANARIPESHEKGASFLDVGGPESAAPQSASANTPLRGGIGSKGGIGSRLMAKTGWEAGTSLGSATPLEDSINSQGGIDSSRVGPGSSASLPEAFGSVPRRSQRSFLREDTSSTSSLPGTPKLSKDERFHFEKLQGSFGARMMAKMGWEAGTGLGASSQGIVTPVESKLRPKPSMGLAYRGFKEKTAQSEAEARRRGETVSDDDDIAATKTSRAKAKDRERSDAWKRPRKPKIKVEHRTYEQILQEAGLESQPTGIGKIYDATSGELREVSIADVTASWTPSTDMMRIPEVRHNLRLIVDSTKGDLNGLAREGKALEERKKWLREEDARLRRKVGEEAELISRLQNVHLIVDEIKSQALSHSSDYEPSLEAFTPYIDKLVSEFAHEYEKYNLDEIVISAISPVVRETLASWDPLQNPSILVDIFSRWKDSFKFSVVEKTAEDSLDVRGGTSAKRKPVSPETTMTPYESLIWNSWLPRVRSSLNNYWSPSEPAPAIDLYVSWSTLLPQFIRDNVLDQLVIPKVQKAVAEWQPTPTGPSLQAIVFPWLPYTGPRIKEVLDDAKRKIKGLLRNWKVNDGVPSNLLAWKDVFDSKDWDAITLKYVLPKLGALLREDFIVNPRKQDMTALNLVLQWHTLFRGSVFSQLLEAEFFPKWLDVLYIWLIQPKVSFAEVEHWYKFWRNVFPQEILDLPDFASGFTRGLQLMNKAFDLGPDVATKLRRPEHRPPSSPPPVANRSRQGTPQARRTPAARVTEVTFRSIVEEFAASHDLLFMPTGRAHEKSRMPLFKVCHSVDGKGGALVFILDDAVWAVEGDDYRAVSLDEMVLRANKSP